MSFTFTGALPGQSTTGPATAEFTQEELDALPDMPPDPLRDYYSPMASGAWRLTNLPMTLCPGYFTGLQKVYGMTILHRHAAVWMSISPMEKESQQIGIDFSRGHVVVFGLGMGWSAAMSALKPEVDRVTVVEMDDEVLAMHRELDLFGRLPDNAGDKVEIVEADALDWKPDTHVDMLMPDIWLDMVSWERAEEVQDMQANVAADMVYFWGQELEVARCAVATGRVVDDAGIAETVAGWNLPLVGLDTPDYAAKTRFASREWMKGRWLEGSEVPRDLLPEYASVSAVS